MLDPEIRRSTEAPAEIEARASLYANLLDAGQTSLDGLRLAAGMGDPAAGVAVARLHATALTNRPGPLLALLKGLPLDHAQLDGAEAHWFDALAGLPLRSLVLNSPAFSCGPDLWQRCPQLALENLEVSGFWRDENDTGLPPLQRLRRLKLSTYGRDFDDPFLEQLSASALEELSLSRCDAITDDGLRALSPLKLRSLTLHRLSELTARGAAHLAGHPLEQLTLGWSRALLDDPSWLSGLGSLRALNLDDCYANESLLPAIRELPIERLSLRSAYIGDEELWALEGMPLAELDLYSSRYSVESLAVLHAFPIKRLGLADIRDLSARALGELRGLALESLDLSLNDLSWNALKQLAGLPLKRLRLSYCGGVDGKLLRKLVDLQLPLQALDISGLDLRDADLACLQDLPLQRLSLFDSPWLTDVGVAHLARLPLEALTIAADAGQAQLTCAAVPALERLPLRYLALLNCSRISPPGWDRLAQLPARVVGPGI